MLVNKIYLLFKKKNYINLFIRMYVVLIIDSYLSGNFTSKQKRFMNNSVYHISISIPNEITPDVAV